MPGSSRPMADGIPLIELVPVDTAGYCDGTIVGNEITISHVDGCGAVLEIRISNWDPDQNGVPALTGYQAQVDCAGFTSGFRGTLAADPSQSFINNTRTDYIFAGLPNETTVDTSELCPTGYAGPFVFGASTLDEATASDPGTATYAGTLTVWTVWDEKGTFTLGFDPAPEATFLLNEAGQHITPIALSPALITIGTGRCCLFNVPPMESCYDQVTDRECAELGQDVYFIAGYECLAGPCPCGVDCLGIEDCFDYDLCTDEFCDYWDACGCAYPPTYDVSTQCCNPDTGGTVPLADGDVCTEDLCNKWTGQVTHVPIHGRTCTDHDDCAPGLCVDQACVCAAEETCCLPDGTCRYIPFSLCDEQGGFVAAACAGDNDGDGRDDMCAAIPTLSEWGVLGMTLVMLAAGTLVILRRRVARA